VSGPLSELGLSHSLTRKRVCICDILVQIRIRGSIRLTYGPDGTFTSVFIDKKSKRSHIIVEIKVFLTFLLVDGKIGSVQLVTDPDPKHWQSRSYFYCSPRKSDSVSSAHFGLSLQSGSGILNADPYPYAVILTPCKSRSNEQLIPYAAF
jgi:hypothetical protein